MVELEPLRNLKALLEDPEWYEDILPYNVELEVVAWAKIFSEVCLRRYRKEAKTEWERGDFREMYVGMIGQKCFDVILQQLEIPADRNDPVVDWRLKKDYDFKIPSLGTIEVKTFDHYCRKVLVKVEDWHHNNYLVVFKFVDEKPTQINMMGWLTREQVENLPISKKGETKYTPLADAYITDFDRLNPAKQFIKMLSQVLEA